MYKAYLSRQQARAWALDNPIGDPMGGPAYGEKTDLATAVGLGAGASLLGGIMGADAASSAADAQAAAAKQADATQRYMYDTTRADNAPFREAGVAANNRLAYLLGLNTSGATGVNPLSRDQVRAELLPQFTKSASASSGGSNDWALARPASGDMSAVWRNTKTGEYREGANPGGFSGNVGNFATWQDALNAGWNGGASAVDEAALNAAIDRRMAQQATSQQKAFDAASGDPAFGSLLRRFSMADLNADPVYQTGLQFGLDQGTQGINRQAAASGQLLSGKTLKELSRYATDYAGTKAGEAYNRFNNDQTNTYNRLAGLSGAGQTATAQVGSAGQNYANNVSANQIGVGNARAASAIGGANALAGGLSGAWNNYQTGQLMNRLLPRSTGGGGYSPSDFGGYAGDWGLA